MDKVYTFKLTEDALKNLVSTYANHKVMCERYEEECEDDYLDLYDDPEYSHHSAYYHSAEEWMRVLGISPESNFVSNIIESEREGR